MQDSTLDRVSREIASAFAFEINQNILQIAEWLPYNINVTYISASSFCRFHRTFNDPNLRWIWYDNTWWYYRRDLQPPRVYHRFVYSLTVNARWTVSIDAFPS